ncbi:MAG TPA: ROK family protein [Propionibacteriaceae bacterium]|jgi:glucokinase|nr:ROK family protein [Propionibacteriaceae bacterium]
MTAMRRGNDQDVVQGDLVIGVDVGGTTIKAAILDSDGLEYRRSEQPTPRHLGPDAVIATTIEAIVELRAELPEGARLRAVGLVVPGIVDAEQGIAVYAANIGWQQLPLRQIVAEAVGLPVILDHDVRAAGLAELELGAGRGLQEVLFVALGTGIAAAVITRGQVSAGATGRAGELGHLPVFPEGEWCACGQRGCTETYASAAALSRRYSAASGISDVPAKDVISRAAAGDRLADEIFQDAITALGRALVNYILLMDPELILIGGGMAASRAAVLRPLTREVQAGLAWRRAPAISNGKFAGDAGRRGAGILAWRALKESTL